MTDPTPNGPPLGIRRVNRMLVDDYVNGATSTPFFRIELDIPLDEAAAVELRDHLQAGRMPAVAELLSQLMPQPSGAAPPLQLEQYRTSIGVIRAAFGA